MRFLTAWVLYFLSCLGLGFRSSGQKMQTKPKVLSQPLESKHTNTQTHHKTLTLQSAELILIYGLFVASR